MSLEHAILGFLAQRPRSGYDLKTRCFDGDARAFWTADQAQVYRTLEKLRAAKLVTSTVKRQSGRPDRRVFDITPAGREVLTRWLETTLPLVATRDPFLLQVLFSSELDDAHIETLFASARDAHQARLDDLREQSVELSRDHTLAPRDAVLRQSAYDGAVAVERALIDWMDECLEALRNRLLPGSGSAAGGQSRLFGSTPA